MTDELSVWLHGSRVALIERDGRGRPRLRYTDEAFAKYPLGTLVLSLALPLAKQRYAQGVTRAFLDGLLPEGESRTAIANDVGVDRDDTYGLIRALGRDCAGAIVVQPADEPAPPLASTLLSEPLDAQELERLVANLRSAPLGAGGRVRVSLAGVQEKLLLTRRPDGQWGRPIDGTPSTHILKPEIAAYPDTVENEAFCMRFARHLGISTAKVETTVVGDRHLIVVERYDREVDVDGAVRRIHQEDLCQAMAIPPQRKYEEDGGPSLRSVSQILQATVGIRSLEQLLRAVTINVLIGNGDAHGKNFSLLHEPTGGLRLAPLYDLICTSVYNDDRLAMCIGGVQRMDRVTTEHLLKEARTWGLSAARARQVVSHLLDSAPSAIEAARDETPGVPDAVVEFARSQLKKLRGTSSIGFGSDEDVMARDSEDWLRKDLGQR